MMVSVGLEILGNCGIVTPRSKLIAVGIIIFAIFKVRPSVDLQITRKTSMSKKSKKSSLVGVISLAKTINQTLFESH